MTKDNKSIAQTNETQQSARNKPKNTPEFDEWKAIEWDDTPIEWDDTPIEWDDTAIEWDD